MCRFTRMFIFQAILGLAYLVAPVSFSAFQDDEQRGRFLVKSPGLYTQFERRGWASEYWSGEVIQNWNTFDPVVGSTVAQEVSLQLDKIKALGVNTITFELRTADPTFTGNFTPPDCNEPPVLGLQFPEPSAVELANLPLFFDLARQKNMKVWLRLVNTHMEQQPPSNSATWIGAILQAVGHHPALDLVLFDGTPYTVNATTCGIPAEPPLWLGPASVPAKYVQWAIHYAMSQGMPPEKLSAEAIVGSFFVDSQPPAGPDATDGHLWSPIVVEKMIFDQLSIATDQRTYALSMYEHRKCSDANGLSCVDVDPHRWADQTLANVSLVVGNEDDAARIVAPEMGDSVGDPAWNAQHALESLVYLFQKYRIKGGSFWRWTSFENSEDSNPQLPDPVKRRGSDFVYNPVEKEVVDMGGFHLFRVPNGSFEGPVDANNVPINWTARGSGTVSRYLLTTEPGEPEVPSRGVEAMRIVTGSGTRDKVAATSVTIPVSPGTAYTTTANLRFGWTGDPDPAGPSSTRPQIFAAILYLQENGQLSIVRAQDSFAYFQEDSTQGFGTFPLLYTTPKDCALVRIQFGAARNGLASQITLDVDNVR
jgi:hypothetical protein